jgi:flagellin
MLVNDNSSSLGVQNAATANQIKLKSALQKLATGLNINQAADDPAGLAASESLRAQIRGSQQAQSNANDALAMLQIADSGSQQISDTLQRMRDLATQAANGTYSSTDRAAIQQEYSSLASEVSDITQSTQYNGMQLLAGNQPFSFQVGDGSPGSNIAVAAAGLSSIPSLGDVSTLPGAQGALASIDTVMGSVSALRSGLGATMNQLSSASTYLGSNIASVSAAESLIRDTDYASATTQLSTSQILTQSSNAMLAQANLLPKGVMGLL